MLGNVWEWTNDWYAVYPMGATTDPVGPTSGKGRVGRGGSWVSGAQIVRAAFRNGDWPDYGATASAFVPSGLFDPLILEPLNPRSTATEPKGGAAPAPARLRAEVRAASSLASPRGRG
jgi:hypothetical protein